MIYFTDFLPRKARAKDRGASQVLKQRKNKWYAPNSHLFQILVLIVRLSYLFASRCG